MNHFDSIEEPLFLPLARAEGLYHAGTADALAKLCTPLEKAVPGDIIGVRMFFKSRWDVIFSYPDASMVRMTETGLKTFSFLQLPETQQRDVAVFWMTAQCCGIDMNVVQWHAEKLGHSHRDYYFFELLLLPDMALLIADHYEDNIFRCYEGEDREQAHIDEAMRVLIPAETTEHGQLVKLRPQLTDAQTLANTLFPVRDDDDAVLPLVLPDLASVVLDGSRRPKR